MRSRLTPGRPVRRAALPADRDTFRACDGLTITGQRHFHGRTMVSGPNEDLCHRTMPIEWQNRHGIEKTHTDGRFGTADVSRDVTGDRCGNDGAEPRQHEDVQAPPKVRAGRVVRAASPGTARQPSRSRGRPASVTGCRTPGPDTGCRRPRINRKSGLGSARVKKACRDRQHAAAGVTSLMGRIQAGGRGDADDCRCLLPGMVPQTGCTRLDGVTCVRAVENAAPLGAAAGGCSGGTGIQTVGNLAR